MRMLRLGLVGTLGLVLLGGTGGTAVAQEVEAPSLDEPHEVTGHIRSPTEKWLWDATWDGERQVEGSQMFTEERIELDDPRLSGSLLRMWNVETHGGARHSGLGEVMTAIVHLVNEDGTWVGTMRGYVAELPRRHYWQFELTGTGAYEGHSALLTAQGRSGASTRPVEGFVYPGPLPEYPPTITDPVKVLVARMDVGAGDPVRAASQLASLAEVGPDVLTERGQVRGRIAAVDIPAGTPITPDLLELAE